MANGEKYFGFCIPQPVYERAGFLIEEVLTDRVDREVIEEVIDSLSAIINTGLEAYYEKPRDLINVSPMVRKAADAGIGAVMSGIRLVLHKVITKAPRSELRKMAYYMKSMLTADSEGNYYVAFQLTESLHELSVELLTEVRTNPNVAQYREDIIAALSQLIEAGTDAYYHQPVGMIELNRLTRKTADFGISTAQKGTNSVVRRIFKVLGHQEMLPLTTYFETLLHSDLKPYSY